MRFPTRIGKPSRKNSTDTPIVLMPLTHSISTGLAFGFIASVLTATAAGRAREVHPVMWLIAALSALELGLRG